MVVSDLHCGCRAGLYPCDDNDLIFDMGMKYVPSNFQTELTGGWNTFWNEFVPEATRDEPYFLVVNGDGIDGAHHNSKTQISQNHADQKRIAKKILAPILNRRECVGLHWIRGTEAHVGQSAEMEETLAEELDAVRDKYQQHSQYTKWLRVGGDKGALIHFAHHIGTTGRTHYETSAVMAELGEMWVEAARWGNESADIVVRSHRHRNIEVRAPSRKGYTIGIVTPAWQGKTPFTQKIPGGRQSEPQFGGIVIRQGNLDHYTRSFVVGVEREPETVLCI